MKTQIKTAMPYGERARINTPFLSQEPEKLHLLRIIAQKKTYSLSNWIVNAPGSYRIVRLVKSGPHSQWFVG